MPVKLYGFTKLGLMEISRPRKGKNIYEVLYKEYFSRSLNSSYMLKVIENDCLKYSKTRNVNKINLNIHPNILTGSEEYLKYFKEEMLNKHKISVNYMYSDNTFGISIIK
jgi:ribonuclease G